MTEATERPDAHERAGQLIPWLVNGSLAAGEAAWLRAHLDVCMACRADLATETRLHEAIRDGGPLVFAGEPSLEKLMARIEADDFATRSGGLRRGITQGRVTPPRSGPRGTRRVARWRSTAVLRWIAAALVIEALGLGALAWLGQTGPASGAPGHPSRAASPGQDVAQYRTLTSAAPRYGAGARVRVVFRADLSLGQLQMLLQRLGAHIVDGPTEADVYTLGFAGRMPSGALSARLAVLRADPRVLFAEPAGNRSP